MFLPMARSDSEFIIKFSKALVPCVCVWGGGGLRHNLSRKATGFSWEKADEY